MEARRMRGWLLVVAGLVAVACTTARLPSAAESIEVEAGARFSLTLDANPTTGYQWRFVQPADEGVVRRVGTQYTPRTPGLLGGGGTEVWTFQAVARGTTTIRLEYVRPWEVGVAPARVLLRPVAVR
jgi:inhibitor of cysteine peptidase